MIKMIKILILIIILFFNFAAVGQSIFKNGDTVKFHEVTTDYRDSFQFRPGCHFIVNAHTAEQSISCDTEKIKRLIVWSDGKVFWHEDPTDTFEHFTSYVHSRPFPQFSIEKDGGKIYYSFKTDSVFKSLQFSINNDTIHTEQLSVSNDTTIYYSHYIKDTLLVIGKYTIECYLIYGRRAFPDTQGPIEEYLFCVEKASSLPILVFKTYSELIFNPYPNEQKTVWRTSIISPIIN